MGLGGTQQPFREVLRLNSKADGQPVLGPQFLNAQRILVRRRALFVLGRLREQLAFVQSKTLKDRLSLNNASTMLVALAGQVFVVGDF